MKNKIKFKQVICCVLTCLSCFTLAPDESDQSLSPEVIKARHEQYVRKCVESYHRSNGPHESFDVSLRRYNNRLLEKNQLSYEYIRKSRPWRGVLVISHRLGTVRFRFKKLASEKYGMSWVVALPLVVLDLLPRLFEILNNDPNFPRAELRTIAHELDINRQYQRHFIASYLTHDGLAKISRVDLILFPDVISQLDEEMNRAV